MESVHKEVKDIHCDKCENTFKSDLALIDHVKITHLKTLSYRCDICEKLFHKKGELSNHFQTNHNTTEFECRFCNIVLHDHFEGCIDIANPEGVIFSSQGAKPRGMNK